MEEGKCDIVKMNRLVFLFSVDGVNRTALNKLLFFVDYVSAVLKKNGETTTNDAYYKKPYGPVPESVGVSRIFLTEKGIIRENKIERKGQYPEYRYCLTDRVYNNKKGLDNIVETVKRDLDSNDIKSFSLVKEKLSGKSASYLSSFSHMIEPWKSARYDDKLDLHGDSSGDWYKAENIYELIKTGEYEDYVEKNRYAY